MHELDSVMEQLWYVVPLVIYYYFSQPNENLDFGLKAPDNDDVRRLSKYIGSNKVVKVYTGNTNLLTYFMSQNDNQICYGGIKWW